MGENERKLLPRNKGSAFSVKRCALARKCPSGGGGAAATVHGLVKRKRG